jgi:hypothetical protein
MSESSRRRLTKSERAALLRALATALVSDSGSDIVDGITPEGDERGEEAARSFIVDRANRFENEADRIEAPLRPRTWRYRGGSR